MTIEYSPGKWNLKNLTARERKHLKEMNIRYKYQLINTIKHQEALEKGKPSWPMCWECVNIAKKMGIIQEV